MRPFHASRIALATLLVAAAPPAAAQAPSAAGVTLPRRGLVRVHTHEGARFYGRVLDQRADSLVLSAPRAPGRRAVAWATVDTVWVQRGTAAVPVGIAGAATFGLSAAWLVHGLSGGDYGPPCRDTCLVYAGAMGAGIGFLVGAAFGSLFPRWRAPVAIAR